MPKGHGLVEDIRGVRCAVHQTLKAMEQLGLIDLVRHNMPSEATEELIDGAYHLVIVRR